jgi:hypothetical protein
MAGMRPFVLSEENRPPYSPALSAGRLPILPDTQSFKPTAVPLWKVIVGPAPTDCNRTRKGPVSFCRAALKRFLSESMA